MLYSLRNRLILAFVLLLAVSFFLLFLTSYNQSGAIIRSDNESSATEKIGAYASLVNMTLTQVYDFASVVYNSEITRSWDDSLSDPDATPGQQMLSSITLSKFLTRTVNNYSVIAAVSISREDGWRVGTDNHIVRDPSFPQTPWFLRFRTNREQWLPAHEDPFETSRLQHHEVVSLLLPIGTFEPSQSDSVMKIDVRTDYFRTPLQQIHLGENGRLFLLDAEGEPVLSQTLSGITPAASRQLAEVREKGYSQGILYDKSGMDKLIYVYKSLKFNNWMLVGAMSERSMLASLIRLKNGILLIAAILLVLSVLAAVWISYGVTKPLSRLAVAMHFVQKGDFAAAEQRLPAKRPIRSEISFVTGTFRNMIILLREHIRNEFELKMRRQQAEYRALLMQINPHFLFNTLELLSSLAMQRRSDDAVAVIESLGKMLRFSLNTDQDLVKLTEEIRYTRYYASILQLRYADRLRLTIGTEGEVERLTLVKFVLQPLVENAVKFAIRQHDAAEVDVLVRREGDVLRLSVADNGIGMDPLFIGRLRDEYAENRFDQMLSAGTRHIGLRNILARCALYYGDAFRFDIRSEPGRGAVITLILPAREGDRDV